MKKILFLSLLLIALGYPALTIMAQDAAQDILEDMLVVEEASNKDVPIAEQIVAQAEYDSEKTTQELIEQEMIAEEPKNVVVVEDEEKINVIKPRNPKTDIIIVESQPKEEILDGVITPMDSAVTDVNVDSSNTHPQLNLTPDKSEMIRLSEKAASVVVGNPNHISVLLDTPDTIIVVPRMQGASHFTVIGENGKVIMQRHVIVGAPADDYVRIRRSCNNGDANCQQTSVYYCPNTCHEVIENNTQSRRR